MTLSCATSSAWTADSEAKTKSPPPDLDFLEYLGTLESDEDNWTDVMNVELPPAKPKVAPGKTQTEAAKSADNPK